MRNVLLAVLVLVTAACGAYRFPGNPSPGLGSVTGTVVAVPCFPVESAGIAQCAGRPVPGVEIDFTSPGGTSQAVTDSAGRYSVTLAGGTWHVHLATYMRLISGPAEVTVSPGSAVSANYVLDSGIRVPVPQQ